MVAHALVFKLLFQNRTNVFLFSVLWYHFQVFGDMLASANRGRQRKRLSRPTQIGLPHFCWFPGSLHLPSMHRQLRLIPAAAAESDLQNQVIVTSSLATSSSSLAGPVQAPADIGGLKAY